ncbi:hypothetical protein ACFVAM_01810 [Streptomyces californicus]|uniref:hypothetical protein n=1 Tax=Streptomyces californicus TaxID=67351 RepID=UPI0036D1AD6C
MSGPQHVPPPPNYPPTYTPAPAYEQHHPATEHTPTKTRWFTGIRPVWNLTAAGAALAPLYEGYSLATGAGTLLTDMVNTGHPSGAWTIDIAVLTATTYINHTRDGWVSRVLLIAAVLGSVLTLPWLNVVLRLMTGATT